MEKVNTARLISERIKRGFNQKYVALSVGVAPSIVSRWERGITIPSRESLKKLSELFGVTIDYLVGTTDDDSLSSNDVEFKSDEAKLLSDYRLLNEQGKEYIRQTMFMALSIYKKHTGVSGVEGQKIG